MDSPSGDLFGTLLSAKSKVDTSPTLRTRMFSGLTPRPLYPRHPSDLPRSLGSLPHRTTPKPPCAPIPALPRYPSPGTVPALARRLCTFYGGSSSHTGHHEFACRCGSVVCYEPFRFHLAVDTLSFAGGAEERTPQGTLTPSAIQAAGHR